MKNWNNACVLTVVYTCRDKPAIIDLIAMLMNYCNLYYWGLEDFAAETMTGMLLASTCEHRITSLGIMRDSKLANSGPLESGSIFHGSDYLLIETT